MNKSATIIGVMLLSPAFSVSHAQDAEAVANIRCLIVGAQLSKSPDATRRSVGMMEVMYYLGRLEKHLQMSDLEALIERESSKMTATELAAEAVRCGTILAEKGQLLQRIGNSLVLRDQEQGDKKSKPSQ
jgi:hypothetical protein